MGICLAKRIKAIQEENVQLNERITELEEKSEELEKSQLGQDRIIADNLCDTLILQGLLTTGGEKDE